MGGSKSIMGMLSSRSSANTSDGDSSSNTMSAIIAAAVVGPICIIGLLLMWCFLWRRRNQQLKGDLEDRQQELQTVYQSQRSDTIPATTEFQWPTRIGEASSRLTQLQQAQERPEKEVVSLSPTATMTTFPRSGTPASQHDYHISPQSFSSELYKQQQQHQHEHELKLKNSGLGMFQPDLAELPPHELAELYQRQPQELPVPLPPPAVVTHELEGSISPPRTPGGNNRVF